MTNRARTFKHSVQVAATEAGPFLPVDALVDTGATYSLLPRALLEELGVAPHDQAEFALADGRTVMRGLATVMSYRRSREPAPREGDVVPAAVDPIAYAAPRVQNPCGSRLRINSSSRALGGGVVCTSAATRSGHPVCSRI